MRYAVHTAVNSFVFDATSLRDLIEFDNIEITFAADITLFPGTEVAVHWTPSFHAEFDPANMFRVLKEHVVAEAEDFLSVCTSYTESSNLTSGGTRFVRLCATAGGWTHLMLVFCRTRSICR